MIQYIGTRSSVGNYCYGDYWYHARHPWPRRQLQASVSEMEKIEGEDRVSVR